MMMWMYSEILIGKYKFRDTLHAVSISKSRKNFGDKATIELPNLENMLKDALKYGDPVTIKLGYDLEMVEEFTGYVSSISPKSTVVIQCEDEMYQLKRQAIEPKSWRSVKLKDLIAYIAPGAIVDVHDITLSPFRIDKTVKSRADALMKIKTEFGLDVFFRGKQLFVGLPYAQDMGEEFYHFQKNAMMDSLEFKRKDDLKIKIQAISINSKNEKIEAEVGDKDGETHTLHFYNLTKSELIKLATSKIDSMKYDGYKGKFKSFGIPFVEHGAVAHLEDNIYKEREGSYFIDGVDTTYNGSDGYKRKIELGRKSA